MIWSGLKCFKEMAPAGQAELQAPQPLQTAVSMVITRLYVSNLRAAYSQTCSQIPQPEQISSSMKAMTGSIATFPWKRAVVALEAAPWA